MSTTSTVAVDGWTIESNNQSAEEMLEGLSAGTETDSPEPRAVTDKGQPVKDAPKDGLSKAASELGKKGAEAAARARKEQAGKDEPAKDGKEAEKGKGKTKEAAGDQGEDADAVEDADKDPKKGNPRHDPTARVAQATREAKEARERAEASERQLNEERRRHEAERRELRERLDRLERGDRPAADTRGSAAADKPAGEMRGGQAAAGDDDPEPQEGEYENYSDWVRAHGAWNRREWSRQTEKQARAHQVASRYAREVDTMLTGWQKMLRDTATAQPDFTEKVKPVTDALGWPTRVLPKDVRPTAQNWIADDLMSAPERAPALLLYLSEHPAELQRIAALSSPRAVTRELAKLEARLDAATTGPSDEREVSKARPPVKPVPGSPHTADDDPDDEDSYDEHVRKMNSKDTRRRR